MYLQVCTELEYIDSYTVHNVCEGRGGEGRELGREVVGVV